MGTTTRNPFQDAITQFSIFFENKVGRLNELLMLFARENVHIMAICALDNTESAITRFIVDYPEEARRLLDIYGFPFNETRILAVEIDTEADIHKVTTSLAAAEINVHYLYPFLMRPHGKCGLVLRLEDNDIAQDVLSAHGVRVLSRTDITR